MDDELYGRVRGFLAAMETLNNGQPDAREAVAFLFQRLPEAESPDAALTRYVHEEMTWTGVSPNLSPVADWHSAVTDVAASLFFLLFSPVPGTTDGEPAEHAHARWVREFVDLLGAALSGAGRNALAWSVAYQDRLNGRQSSSWFCHAHSNEFVFETAQSERFLLALGHDD